MVLDPHILEEKRRAKGWTQSDLANAAGIDSSVISRLERGLQQDLRASIFIALAEALETTLDSLIAKKSTAEAELDPELAFRMDKAKTLAIPQQKHLIAILRGFFDGLSK